MTMIKITMAKAITIGISQLVSGGLVIWFSVDSIEPAMSVCSIGLDGCPGCG